MYLLNAFGGHKADDLLWHVEVLGCHIAKRDPVLGQQTGQRVHGPPVLQVTHHGDLKEGYDERDERRNE